MTVLGAADTVEAQMTLSVASCVWNCVPDIKVVLNKFPVWVSVNFVKGPILSRTQSISLN